MSHSAHGSPNQSTNTQSTVIQPTVIQPNSTNVTTHSQATHTDTPAKWTAKHRRGSPNQRRLRDWWEFQELYQLLSRPKLKQQPPSSLPVDAESLPELHTAANHAASVHPTFASSTFAVSTHTKSPYMGSAILTPRTHVHEHPTAPQGISIHDEDVNHYCDGQNLPSQYKDSGSRQAQSKRQREWVYLCHYLAITGLNPIHIISGDDDGREPDFTLVFYRRQRLYYIGIELTTLPRLRDQMGDAGLIAKRWYWQGLRERALARQQTDDDAQSMGLYNHFRLPVTTLYMPLADFRQRPHQPSVITQADMDAVMSKKAHKADAYHTRRPLHELWLLVHTDKYQPDSILVADQQPLTHTSRYDQIQITRYPSHKLITVAKQHG